MQTNGPGEGSQSESTPNNAFSAAKSWMIRWRGSRRLVLVIVAIALLLDNMLLTVVGKFLFYVIAPSDKIQFLPAHMRNSNDV